MSAPDRHDARLRTLVQDALERPYGERRAFIDAACGGDRALQEEVWSLLEAADADSTGLLARPPSPPAPLDPATLGLERGWQVIRELARGGMSVVYLAERVDGAYDQQVALKLIQPTALPDQEAILRLKLERQILARLNHPHIARLLDGGTSSTGMPYLVMEFVDGDRLDHWCESRGLDMEARLRLFLKVCDAVAYAHRHQVVHRDLKPGNILVTDVGEPKLLDFGIARWLAEDSTLTREGGQMLTPRFASPEQIRGEAVTTLSDLYSLGVMLYELLTGRSPYGALSDQPHRLAQAICDSEPDPPSATSAGTDLIGKATLQHRARRLRGNLDAIVLKCLRKQPTARYASVDELIDDINAHLEGRPVQARQGSRRYRFGVFMRRHWVAVSTAVGVTVLVAAFVFGLMRQLEATRIERDKNARTLAFVTDLFRIADPSEARGSSVTVREVLDRGALLLRGDLGLEDPVRHRLLLTIGTVYRQLGLLEHAESALTEALQASEDVRSTDSIAARMALAGVRVDQGRFDLAAALLDASEAALPADADAGLRGRLLHQRGELNLRQARLTDSEAPLLQALALRTAAHGQTSREVAETHTLLGSVARDRGDLDQAEAHYQTALDTLTRLGQDPWNRAKVVNNLAIIAADRGDIAAAEGRLREALELMRSAVGEDHPLVATGLGNVASMMTRRGDYAGAEPLLARALAVRRLALGETHPLTATSLANLGYLRFANGGFEAAADDLTQALAIQRDSVGLAHPHAQSTLRNLAAVEYARGDLAAAARWNQVQIDAAMTTLGADHPLLLQAAARLAFLRCLSDDCDLDALHDAAAAHRARLGPGHAEAGESLAHAAAAAWWSHDVRACQKAQDARAALAPTLSEAHWDRALADFAAAHCDGLDPLPAWTRLARRYGAGHPLLQRLAQRDAIIRP
jgi:eukaryotic-like serine/threonine-protein kinase